MMSMNITIQLFTSLSIVLLLLGGLSENRVSTVQLAPVEPETHTSLRVFACSLSAPQQ